MHAEEVARLVDRFGPEIYRYCHRLTGRTQQAEDLYQQTFLKCLELTLTLDERSNPRALLFSLAGGIFKNEQRKAGRRLAIARPVELDGENAPEPPAPDDPARTGHRARPCWRRWTGCPRSCESPSRWPTASTGIWRRSPAWKRPRWAPSKAGCTRPGNC